MTVTGKSAKDLNADLDLGESLLDVRHRALSLRLDLAKKTPVQPGSSPIKKASEEFESRLQNAHMFFGSNGFDIKRLGEVIDQIDSDQNVPLESEKRPMSEQEGLLSARYHQSVIERQIAENIEETAKAMDEAALELITHYWQHESEWQASALSSCFKKSKRLPFYLQANELDNSYAIVDQKQCEDPVLLQAVSVYADACRRGCGDLSIFRSIPQNLQHGEAQRLWKILIETTGLPSSSAEFCDRARRYLENEFLSYVTECVQADPVNAKLGGQPSIFAFVRSFLKLRRFETNQPPHVDNLPAHVFIFHCIRCGDFQGAYEAAVIASLPALADAIEGLRWSTNEVNSSQRRIIRERLSREYSKMNKTTRNVELEYKSLLYNIL
ncbi:hypothetical protein ACOME3_004645 [Neoechinorhynchus agilis]